MKTQRLFASVLLAMMSLVLNQPAGLCLNNLAADTPSSQFVLLGPLVRHQTTGLIWSRCRLGLTWNVTTQTCAANLLQASLYTWFEAQTAANSSQLESYSDWRLPNKNELMSLVEHACTGPAINEAIFPNTPLGAFWTSSPSSIEPGYVWRLGFTSGDMVPDSVNATFYVRLVRAP